MLQTLLFLPLWPPKWHSSYKVCQVSHRLGKKVAEQLVTIGVEQLVNHHGQPAALLLFPPTNQKEFLKSDYPFFFIGLFVVPADTIVADRKDD